MSSGVFAAEEPEHTLSPDLETLAADGGLPPEMHSDAGLDEHYQPSLDAGVGHDGVTPYDAGMEVVISDIPAVIDRPGAVELRFRLGFINEWANQPTAPLGLAFGFRLGGRNWAAMIETWGLIPSMIGNDTASMTVMSFGGVTGVCYEHPILTGELTACALGRAGVMRFEPHNDDSIKAQWQPLMALGLRIGGEWPRESFLAFYTSLQGFVPILRGSLVGQTIGWQQKWFFGGVQVGIRMRLE